MSEPEKKDDHGAAHGGGHGEKKTLPKKLTGVIIAALAVLLFLMILTPVASMTIDAASEFLKSAGQSFRGFGSSIRSFGIGFRIAFMELLLFIFLFIAGGLILWIFVKEIFPSKKDEGHH